MSQFIKAFPMRLFVAMAFFCFSMTATQAQSFTVKGKIADAADNSPINGATVTLTSAKNATIVKSVVSNTSGAFTINGVDKDTFYLTVTYISYGELKQRIIVNKDIDLGTLTILKEAKDLTSVVVVGRTPPTIQKGDTIQYNASQYKVNPDANVEDLVKKMPGITVDKSGTVTAHGEQVKKVTVDGKDFFGDDATAALKNLPADVIDKIQVFDKLSDQAQLTGFDDGNSVKSINIVTKTGMKNGQFGRIYAGYGTDERYNAGGNVSFFKGDRRISIVGLFNNVNQQNFSAQDLLGVTTTNTSGSGSRGGRGGGGGGGNRGGGPGGQNFGNTENYLVGQQSGISKTNAIGINFSDVWDKKLEVSGSYFYNNSNNINDQISNTQYFLTDTTNQYNDENTHSANTNYNHRINARFNYKIDSSNTLLIVPSINFQDNKVIKNNDAVNYLSLTDTVNTSDNSTYKKTSGYNISNSILYRHAFAKKGRSITLGLNTSLYDKDGDTYQDTYLTTYSSILNKDTVQQHNEQQTNGYQLSGNITYTEPIGKKGQLQLNYNPSYTKNKSDQQVMQYDSIENKFSTFDTSLSNKFDNTVTTQNGGITYRRGDRDNGFWVGVYYQNTVLENEQTFPEVGSIRKSFNNFLPNFMWRKKISSKASIRVFYRASTTNPSISKLQNVYDYTDPLFISTGNPNLKQQTNNVLNTRYTYTNTGKGTSLFANVFVQQANDYITNGSIIAEKDTMLTETVILNKGSQLSMPVNMDGFLSLRSFFTYAMPVKFIKSNVNFNAGFSWSKTPGIVNGVKSRSDNYNYNGGVVVASNINEYIDFNVFYNASYTVSTNTLQPQLNNNYLSQNSGIQLNLLSKKGWFVQNDIANQSYSGLSADFDQSYWLWNAAIGKKFLKKQAGELKLSVFDLLKQNQSITRNITETYIEDVRNTVLQQYFMLTFTYKLKNFGVAKPTTKPNQDKGGMMPGFGPGF